LRDDDDIAWLESLPEPADSEDDQLGNIVTRHDVRQPLDGE
jgi:hypothetical protein